MISICGVDCNKCELKKNCKGCQDTKGKPFGKQCFIAKYCLDNNCGKNLLKKQLINEFNNLKIKGMKKITDLNALKGSFVNLEYQLTNGKKIKLLDDDKIYLGNQIIKNKNRCYGIVADDKMLLVCEYGINGENPEIIIYKKIAN